MLHHIYARLCGGPHGNSVIAETSLTNTGHFMCDITTPRWWTASLKGSRTQHDSALQKAGIKAPSASPSTLCHRRHGVDYAPAAPCRLLTPRWPIRGDGLTFLIRKCTGSYSTLHAASAWRSFVGSKKTNYAVDFTCLATHPVLTGRSEASARRIDGA